MYKFKEITTVPPAKDCIDIVLSRTQRKTPTEVHPGFKISRIRNFYIRKVKFCQSTFSEKLQNILEQFPRIDDIHPFYADLCNVLYDRDHYKIALGQVHALKNIIDKVAKEYVRMMKFADSLYKCKTLKRAALGRMCTAMKRQNSSFVYLDEVRQHLARLPSINPATRTLILTGYPNVGKSSFMNIVTNANVDVQPYAFTTKSLFLGHMDFSYSRWQVIDTPGILDHPLEERNTIEMTAITALAHIPATVLFFLDLSESCGYRIRQQVDLFHSIKPLFKNKPLLIILNKIDLKKVEDLDDDDVLLIKKMTEGGGPDDIQCELFPTSCATKEGVDKVKNHACELLLQKRMESKLANGNSKTDAIRNRIHVTNVVAPKNRPPFIPEAVKAKQLPVPENGEEFKQIETEKDLEEKFGGAGVYTLDTWKNAELKDDSWKYDVLPQVMDGQNVWDFIDEDIAERVVELEKEEDLLLQADKLSGNDEILEEWRETQTELGKVWSIRNQRRVEKKMKKSHNHMGQNVDRKQIKSLVEVAENLVADGHDPKLESLATRGRDLKRKRAETRGRDAAVGESRGRSLVRGASQSQGRSQQRSVSRLEMGLSSSVLREQAEVKRRKKMRQLSKDGRKGEGDHWIPDMKPKHLFSGKRGIGKTDRR